MRTFWAAVRQALKEQDFEAVQAACEAVNKAFLSQAGVEVLRREEAVLEEELARLPPHQLLRPNPRYVVRKALSRQLATVQGALVLALARAYPPPLAPDDE